MLSKRGSPYEVHNTPAFCPHLSSVSHHFDIQSTAGVTLCQYHLRPSFKTKKTETWKISNLHYHSEKTRNQQQETNRQRETRQPEMRPPSRTRNVLTLFFHSLSCPWFPRFSQFFVYPGHPRTIQYLIPARTTIVELLQQVKKWQRPSRDHWSNCRIHTHVFMHHRGHNHI